MRNIFKTTTTTSITTRKIGVLKALLNNRNVKNTYVHIEYYKCKFLRPKELVKTKTLVIDNCTTDEETVVYAYSSGVSNFRILHLVLNKKALNNTNFKWVPQAPKKSV